MFDQELYQGFALNTPRSFFLTFAGDVSVLSVSNRWKLLQAVYIPGFYCKSFVSEVLKEQQGFLDSLKLTYKWQLFRTGNLS